MLRGKTVEINPDPSKGEYTWRIIKLMVDRDMTLEAAKTVIDAAMYGIGCTEGRVREETERRKSLDKV